LSEALVQFFISLEVDDVLKRKRLSCRGRKVLMAIEEALGNETHE
jgi:hypothetical protein